jgi:transketolase
MNYPLHPDTYNDDVPLEATRVGFGRGLKSVGESDERIVALGADVTESTQVHFFRDAFPERFIQVGIAEQNLATVAAGVARAGKIPFISSYAAFSPGRNWEQLKTTAALNEQPVKVIGSHAGLYTGPDGGTHQMLEDIAIMRVIPHFVVVVPGDSLEAEKATIAVAHNDKPSYIRVAREKTPVFTLPESPFEVGKAYVLREGDDVSLLGTGTMTHKLLIVAQILADEGVNAEVVHVPTIKPLDEETILSSVRKNGRVVTAEEAQIAGGFGGAIAELLGEKLPVPIHRVGVEDRFGESGTAADLFEAFKLTPAHIADRVRAFIDRQPKYHQ